MHFRKKIAKPLEIPLELFKDIAAPFHNKDFWVIKKRLWLIWLLWIIKTLVAFTVLAIIGTISFFTFAYFYTGDLKDDHGKPIDFEKIGNADYKKASYVLDSKDNTIGPFFDELRDPVQINEVPQLMKDAFIATEDQRFYSWIQFGIDPIAIARAGMGNGLHRMGIKYWPKSGASGIPQQVTRLLYAYEIADFHGRAPTFSRKIKEARIAIQLVRRYPKDKILETFLNLIYFDHGINGVAEARRRYFNKNSRNDPTSIREVAILASQNKSPRKYCPIFHKPKEIQVALEMDPERYSKLRKQYDKDMTSEITRVALARQRYNWVIGRLWEEGYIPSESYYKEALFTKDDSLDLDLLHVNPLKNPDFGNVIRLVKEMLFFSGYKDKDITSYGGFRIMTSFDSGIQKIVTEELDRQLVEINREFPSDAEKLEGSFVAIDNKTGHILAMIGGHDQFNRSLASRSPGSLFKPFTYAAAFEYLGKTLDDTICNCDFRMPDQMTNSGHVTKWWSPRNFVERNPVRKGRIPLPVGLIRSVNLATLNLAREVGIKNVIQVANDMGVHGNLKMIRDSDGKVLFSKPGINEISGGLVPYLPTAIGASDVNLLEMVNAFTVFARGGTYIPPSLILEIKDSHSKTIYKANEPKEKRVLSEETSKKITTLLRAVTKIGTAKITMRNVEQQVACKTGTSNGPRDLSLICFTPEMTIGIRIGYDSSKAIELPEYMKRATGVSYLYISGSWVAGPAMRKIIDRIYKDRPKVEFSSDIEERLQDVVIRYGNQ